MTGWRERLPMPMDYFRPNVEGIEEQGEDGWAAAICPLHGGRERTLRIDMSSRKGRWQCSVCGSGDLITFAERLHSLPFALAKKELLDFQRRLIMGVRVPGQVDVPALRQTLEQPLSPTERRKFVRDVSEQRRRDEGVWPPIGGG